MHFSGYQDHHNLDLFSITGYNLDYAQISIMHISDYYTPNIYNESVKLCASYTDYQDEQLWHCPSVSIYANNAGMGQNRPTVNYDGENELYIYGTGYSDWADIILSITAQFPEEDTGYIEDGFDYCVDPGANLMSYPCDSAVALLDAIPSDALSQFSGIIGQGIAATQLPNGTWVGSLTAMQASSGYWIQSNTALCFNYDCSEN